MSPARSYGLIHRPVAEAKMEKMPLAASVVFKALGGKFMVKDGSDQYAIAVAGSTQIAGWADIAGDFTSSSTAGADKVPIIIDLNAVFELPVDAGDTALTAASLATLIGKTCDLIVTSNIQGADINASSTDVIKIVGGNVADNTVYVQINPGKFYTAGVV